MLFKCSVRWLIQTLFVTHLLVGFVAVVTLMFSVPTENKALSYISAMVLASCVYAAAWAWFIDDLDLSVGGNFAAQLKESTVKICDKPPETVKPVDKKRLVPLVYVAGPYRAATEWGLVKNIRKAEELALRVWSSGAACICPHKNVAHYGGAVQPGPGVDDEIWLNGDLEMLRRCDAVLLTDNWESSKGATAEAEFANSIGIPVFLSFDVFEAWLKNELAEENPDTESAPDE